VSIPKSCAPASLSSSPVKCLSSVDERLAPSVPTDTCQTDPDLTAVLAAWPELPQAIRTAILAMVTAAVGSEG
jgi:hypothetical protein